jgi:hypothetical protein
MSVDPGADKTQLARVEDLLHDIAAQTKRREVFASPAVRRALQAERLALEATARALKRLREDHHTRRQRDSNAAGMRGATESSSPSRFSVGRRRFQTIPMRRSE